MSGVLEGVYTNAGDDRIKLTFKGTSNSIIVENWFGFAAYIVENEIDPGDYRKTFDKLGIDLPYINRVCTCGAAAIKSPGHSVWCDIS